MPVDLGADMNGRAGATSEEIVPDLDISGFHQNATGEVAVDHGVLKDEARQFGDVHQVIVGNFIGQWLRERHPHFRFWDFVADFGHLIGANGTKRAPLHQLHLIPDTRDIGHLGVRVGAGHDFEGGTGTLCGDDGLIITMHICGIIALPLEVASLETERSLATGKVCGIGVRGLDVTIRRLDGQTFEVDILAVEADHAHARLCVDRHILKHRGNGAKNENGGAEVKRIEDRDRAPLQTFRNRVVETHFVVAEEFTLGEINRLWIKAIVAVLPKGQSGERHLFRDGRFVAKLDIKRSRRNRRDFSGDKGFPKIIDREAPNGDLVAMVKRNGLHPAFTH